MKKIGKNISIELESLIKLTTPFTILNKNFNEMDFIRHAMNSEEKSTTERLQDDYGKIFKSDLFIIYFDKEIPVKINGYV